MTRIKVCGLTRQEDAELAAELGASALGFIFEPSSPRFLKEVPAWLSSLPPYVARVAVYGPVLGEVTSAFQAVQAVEFGNTSWPGWRLGVVRLQGNEEVEDVLGRFPGADALVLDAHRVGAYGGTGQVIDWGMAAEIVAGSRRPVVMAGGLTPANVARAVEQVRPFAVDVSSGIELEPGVKSSDLMRAFFDALK